MISHRSDLRRLLPAVLCVLFGTSFSWAQVAQGATSTATIDATTLAKYDKNKNGKLDPDELAALKADEEKAKAAAKEVETASSSATVPGGTSEDVIQLSPFEVKSGEEKGYAATSTMSGTRLNSKLEDIASSISVVTKQQLADTASVDINDIFLYEVGVEGMGQYTETASSDAKGEYDNGAANPTGSNRMRGLSSATITVDGFSSGVSNSTMLGTSTIPVDTYNLDSVEIARGSNSNLAGLGEAGGTVNLVTGRANVTRETTSVTARVDSYGGYRFQLNLNRPIIKNMLSLRFDAVYGNTGYVRKPAYDLTNRQSLSLTFKPFKNTNISASWERFHENAVRANTIMPKETITYWKQSGSPTWDPVTRTYTVNGVRSAAITTSSALPAGAATLGSSSARVLQYIDDGQINYMMRGAATANTIMGTTAMTTFVSSAAASTTGLYSTVSTTSKSIYDYTDINLAASGYEIQRSNSFRLSLDQAIFSTQRQRMDVSLAWRREDSDDYRHMYIAQSDGVGSTVNLDLNEHLIDGRANPYYLRPYIGGVNPQIYKRPVLTDTYRYNLAYQLDLRHEQSLLKWLGLQRVAAYQEYRRTISSPSSLRYHDSITNNTDFTGTPTSSTTSLAASNGCLFYPLYYMGKTQGGGVEYANSGPVRSTGKFNASYNSSSSTAWNYTDPVNISEVIFSASKQKQKIRTAGATLQSYFLNDQVVTTVGMRKDRTYSISDVGINIVNNYYDETNLDNFGTGKVWNWGKTKNKGVVVKPFRSFKFLARAEQEGNGFSRNFAQLLRGMSVSYNKSDSFQPQTAAYSVFLEELPNPTNQTEEYGIGLNMFDGRFSMRLVHQKTLQKNTRATSGTIASRALSMDFDENGYNRGWDLYDMSTGWYTSIHPDWTSAQCKEAAAKMMGYSVDYINAMTNKTISDVSDAVSKGWELEMQFNPDRFWTLKLTGSQQEAMDTNISDRLQRYLDMRLPYWQSVTVPTDVLSDGTQLTNAGASWWTTQWSSGSNGSPYGYYLTNVRSSLATIIANSGKKKPQSREYQFSMLTSYQLAGIAGNQKWLKNASVGGSFRWASKSLVGYLGAAADSDGVVRSRDTTKPVYANPTANVDLNFSYTTRLFSNKIRTRFQLNVKNVTENGHLQGTSINPDGQYCSYRIVDPRQFIFTTTFDL